MLLHYTVESEILRERDVDRRKERCVGAGMDKSVQSHLAVLTCVFLPNPVTGIIVHGDTISLKKTHTFSDTHTYTNTHSEHTQWVNMDGPRPGYAVHCTGKLCKWFIVDELM